MQLFLMLDINETPAQATGTQLLGSHFGISVVALHWHGCKWNQNLACAVPLQSRLRAELRFTGKNVHISAKPIGLSNLRLHIFEDSLYDQWQMQSSGVVCSWSLQKVILYTEFWYTILAPVMCVAIKILAPFVCKVSLVSQEATIRPRVNC